MPPSNPPTIHALKTSFLQAQITSLSQPLPDPAPQTSTPSLSQRDIDTATYKLNEQIRKHSKLVYSSIATRHVAEQIERLYFRAGERSVLDGELGGVGGEEDGLNIGEDFVDPEAIASLPAEWDNNSEEEDTPSSRTAASEYSALVTKLQDLSTRRSALQAQISQYRALQSSLQPFADPKAHVQPNLCTKNGEVEVELQRMRMLLARVGGRIAGLEGRDKDGDGDGDVEMGDRDEKVRALLAL